MKSTCENISNKLFKRAHFPRRIKNSRHSAREREKKWRKIQFSLFPSSGPSERANAFSPFHSSSEDKATSGGNDSLVDC